MRYAPSRCVRADKPPLVVVSARSTSSAIRVPPTNNDCNARAATSDTALPNSGDTALPNSGDTALPNSGDTALPNPGDTALPNSAETALPNPGIAFRLRPPHAVPPDNT